MVEGDRAALAGFPPLCSDLPKPWFSAPSVCSEKKAALGILCGMKWMALWRVSSSLPPMEWLTRDKSEGANTASVRTHPSESTVSHHWVPLRDVPGGVMDRPGAKKGRKEETGIKERRKGAMPCRVAERAQLRG